MLTDKQADMVKVISVCLQLLIAILSMLIDKRIDMVKVISVCLQLLIPIHNNLLN
jgi:hypothetical protein